MSAPAQVTEAHRKLRIELEAVWMKATDEQVDQLIADSEARAIREALVDITCTHHTDKERHECPMCLVTQLRAEVEQVQNVVIKTRKCSIDAMNRIRALVGATNGDPHPAEHYVAEALKSLRVEVERLQDRESNQSARIRYLEGATNHATGTPLSLAIARAEKAEAELTAERARLDWLQKQDCDREIWRGLDVCSNIRAAIDAAMKE